MGDWESTTQRLGIPDAEQFVREEIAPLLDQVPRAEIGKNGRPTAPLLHWALFAMFGFFIAFESLDSIFDEDAFGVTIRMILFPFMFVGALALVAVLNRRKVAAAVRQGMTRYELRARALTRLADAIGLAFTPAPGGAPETMRLLASLKWAPAIAADLTQTYDRHGGLHDEIDIARRSGVMTSPGAVLAGAPDRARLVADAAALRQVEDGFKGKRGGIDFSAFEWIENDSDGPSLHYLTLIFTAPFRLHGVSQLRSRNIAWPASIEEAKLAPVGIVAPAFEERFRLRASDQVEARAIFDPLVLDRIANLAHGERVRAVAFEDYLVISVAGADRFAMVNLETGAWSEETIRQTMGNIADMLELVDAVSRAFCVRAAASPEGTARPH